MTMLVQAAIARLAQHRCHDVLPPDQAEAAACAIESGDADALAMLIHLDRLERERRHTMVKHPAQPQLRKSPPTPAYLQRHTRGRPPKKHLSRLGLPTANVQT